MHHHFYIAVVILLWARAVGIIYNRECYDPVSRIFFDTILSFVQYYVNDFKIQRSKLLAS